MHLQPMKLRAFRVQLNGRKEEQIKLHQIFQRRKQTAIQVSFFFLLLCNIYNDCNCDNNWKFNFLDTDFDDDLVHSAALALRPRKIKPKVMFTGM